MVSGESIDSGDSTYDILLVEDNPGDVRLLQEAMRDTQIESNLHVVSDGAAALEFVRQQDDYEGVPSPDLMLLDLNLPQTDGIDVLCELDECGLTYMPVIVLSSSRADEDIRQAYECGANAYLSKPLDPTEFVRLVQSITQFWFGSAQLPPLG